MTQSGEGASRLAHNQEIGGANPSSGTLENKMSSIKHDRVIGWTGHEQQKPAEDNPATSAL